MNRMGEQGEHFGKIPGPLPTRTSEGPEEAAPLLTLLTPASRPTSGDHLGGDLG